MQRFNVSVRGMLVKSEFTELELRKKIVFHEKIRY